MIDIENEKEVTREWGSWTVLDRGDGYKIKILTIKPNKSISLQYHKDRTETWCVVSGRGSMIVGERCFPVEKHSSLYIPVRVTHKVTNTSSSKNLVIVEVQQGESCREDDIVRIGEIK